MTVKGLALNGTYKGSGGGGHLHEGTASSSHQAEHGEGVDDEPHLFVGQQRVEEYEPSSGQQQRSHASVQEANGNEEQRATQRTWHGGVKVPKEGRGLLGERS